MIRSIESKTILSGLQQTDSYFGIRYNMNLYRGCQHGCIYCDTRSECYRVGDISNIAVKQNAIELLRKELTAKRGKKTTIGTGSMNDPYMHLEGKLKMTQKTIQTIADFRFPVHIITKSDLVMRDYEILQQITQTYAAVSFTITSADDQLSRCTEPFAPTSSARFKALQYLAGKGIYTGITLMPILPFINDTDKNIETILKMAKDAGASYVIPLFGVTLRQGSRDYFYNALETKFPGVKEKYQECFQDKYECFRPRYQALYTTFNEWSDKLNLPSSMQFYNPVPEPQLSLFP